ncbi:hypothetical protein COOONC_28155 [Cooperia oncophora]
MRANVFCRSLPKTLEFLKKEMGGVQMDFLNKVADNSRPNGFPLLFGKSLEQVGRVGRPPEAPDWNNTKICEEYLDKYPYIPEEYRKKGYKVCQPGIWHNLIWNLFEKFMMCDPCF